MQRFWGAMLVFSLVSAAGVQAEELSEFPRTAAIIDVLVSEHEFDAIEVEAWFAQGEYIARNVESLAKPAETTKTYAEYRPLFVSDETVENGKRFMEQQARWLSLAEQRTGVPGEVIAAIMGVETRYGNFLGVHRTFDALATLAVTEGRRADYFQRELINFLLISRDQSFDPLSVKGSYAGAMGYPQFMPSSYLAYADDLDGDGNIDIWSDPVDAIGSIARYLDEHGWQSDEPIATRAHVSGEYRQVELNSFNRDRTLAEVAAQGWDPLVSSSDDAQVHPIRLDGDDGAEFWLGYRNFWVISRYNRSIAYSMAIFQLSEALRLAQ
ncbi:lytic murein transglycosylase B [Saccharospirillum impatiens]|uniref:lytic murein transglycosylase B n=1 Tax=Saccharospirillum impatiens TaxID=169438 RepID=UPI00040484F1|nr:lytic murein transglycosylase B [Saccharospirillum impatiens]